MSETAAAPQAIDLLISARWIVPVVPENIVLEHHAVAVDDGRIIAVLPLAEAEARFQPKQKKALGRHVLLPGLINMHGHAAMTLFRGLADDLPLMTWLNDHIWPAERRFVDENFVADGTLLAIAEMIRGGTTTFSDMYFFPEVTAEVAHSHRIRSQICFPVLDFPTSWGSGPEEYLRKGLNLYDRYRNSEWINVGFGPHAPYTLSDGPMRQIVSLAEEIDATIQIHLHETAFEVQEAINNTGLRPTQRLAELGMLTPRTQCVHMTQIDDHDVRLLVESGATVVHCPESNLKLASGFCPTEKLRAAGVNLTLGTDGAASNNDLDLLGEMRTAALLAKAVSGNAAALNAHQTLAMTTINAARALGRDNDLGSLETGKLADIIAIDLSDDLCQPVYDPVSHLVYSVNSRQVSHNWIGGELHLENGELLRIDLHSLRERVADWATRIRAEDR
ncbi:TRZ/ATZ family hydrolase [Mangrovitalea sediminis]|uniref:TRZ/ATZ family hydrolase n=1 Tax=Mangrovitalea sediminis TaxID=1982043 RepID=UPI000BE572C3|nr:TRZ/ATZ family hydrolase [Mangrovitalea sediminis]